MIKKVTAVVQARIGSQRHRGKVLKKINNKETILLLLNRLSQAKEIDRIIVAIPNRKKDDPLHDILNKNNYEVFRGSEKNVLNRFFLAAKFFNAKHIMRITADCPLVDFKLLNSLIKKYLTSNFDYVSNVYPKRSFPDGLDAEIFNYKSVWKNVHTTSW